MPRKNVLSELDKQLLLNIPPDFLELSKNYLLSETDIALINQKRGNHNKLGFALLLCCIRYPGIAFNEDTIIPIEMLEFISSQLKIKEFFEWKKYFSRETTRWEHIAELKKLFGFKSFTVELYHYYLQQLIPQAKQTDRGMDIAQALVSLLRKDSIIVPDIAVIERLCSETITIGSQEFYSDLIESLLKTHKKYLDELLKIKIHSKVSYLHWLLEPAMIPNPKHILDHIERLNFIKSLSLPENIGKNVHQNRLSKLAREGKNMFARDIGELEPRRKYATLVAVIINTKESIIDEIIELNDKVLGSIFNKAKNSHNEEFQKSSKTINEKLNLYVQIGQALITAKQDNLNPFEVIESIIPWGEFTKTINDTKELAKPDNFDFLYRISRYYSWMKRYMTAFLEVLEFKSSSNAKNIIAALNIIKEMHKNGYRKVPANAPIDFIKKRWSNLLWKEGGNIDRQFYEFAVVSELKSALRSGDISVLGSLRYKDFEEYLLDKETYNKLKTSKPLPIRNSNNFKDYIYHKMELLESNLDEVNKLAGRNELIDVSVNNYGLRIAPLTKLVPDEADIFNHKIYSLLPKIKITQLLQEVDGWINYTDHFTHLKNDRPPENKSLLLTAILADAINLGLTNMAEACPGTSYFKLASMQAWHIREDTYKAATATIVNAQHKQEIARYWGEGTSSSSDGQRFKAGDRNAKAGSINPKYGNDPGLIYYSHTSDLYAPFHINIISTNIRDSTFVLDGLLRHEADLNIYEHYTDTAGFTDHVFALMHLLGFKFAPRIKDLNDKRIYIPPKSKFYDNLSSMIGGTINLNLVERNWEEIIRLALSIQHGTVTSSLILRKLGSYPRQNNLALALRELGKIERSIFMLNWIKDPALRRRVHVGLNKGEAKHSLTRAVHFNRLGEIRDRSFENQLYRASGLNLVVGAITLWNTVYISKAVEYLKKTDTTFDENLVKHSSPLVREHINLTGDYIWSPKPYESKLRIE